MIFVTVGTGRFETLVKEIDRIAHKLKDKIIVQIGSGEYIPKNCKWFRFAPDLHNYYKQASLIIGHGGPGTVFEILDTGKKFIACANRDRTDPKHQVEFLEAISKDSASLFYCKNVSNLLLYIKKSKKHKFIKYKKPKCWMVKEVSEYMKNTSLKPNRIWLIGKLALSYVTLIRIVVKSGAKNVE